MKVRNYIVENSELFLDCLEKELCQNNISYVKIGNEIHFLDEIIRFYDFDKDMRTIINLQLMTITNEMERLSKMSYKTSFKLFKKIPELRNNLPIEKNNFIKPLNNYQSRNKSIQKYESNRVNQKIKRYP